MVIKDIDKAEKIRNSQEYKKLVRKNFIEQKLKEIGLAILGIALLIIVPYIIGYFNLLKITSTQDLPIWIIGFLSLIISGFCLGIFYFIVFCIYGLFREWIESNLKKARRRANKKFDIEDEYEILELDLGGLE